MTTVIVRIENAYSDGHESQTDVPVRAPGGDIEEWWQDEVYPHTGDGHGVDGLGSYYKATIIHADEEELVGLSMEWA